MCLSVYLTNVLVAFNARDLFWENDFIFFQNKIKFLMLIRNKRIVNKLLSDCESNFFALTIY